MELSLARQIKKLKSKTDLYSQKMEQNFSEHDSINNDIQEQKVSIPTNLYAEMTDQSKPGEILRVYYDNTKKRNQINPSAMIELLNIGTTQQEVDDMKLTPVGMSEIFNTWYRFSHWRNEQNLSGNTGHAMTNNQMSGYEHEATRNAWSYDASTQMIKSNRNSPVYSAFISEKKLSTYYILVRCDGGGDTDNDGILINLAYMKDANGVEHTIDLVRARMGVGNIVYLDETGMEFHWSIVYDYRMNTQFELATNTNIKSVSGGWGNNYIYMSAERQGNKLTCKCSDWNSSEILENSVINYTLPDTKPSNYTDEMYNNLKTMLNYSAKMGVGAHSQNGLFTIVDQRYIFDDSKIYDLVNNAIWEYDENDRTWYNVGTADVILKNGHVYFNKLLEKLYYYDNSQLMEIGK